MAKFSFRFLDNGKVSAGTLEAPDHDAAMLVLSQRYETLVGLEEIKPRRQLFGKRVSAEELMVFTQQLATMLRAGVTLRMALDILLSDAEGSGMKSVLENLSVGVSEGRSLSEVMAQHPRVFNRLYVHMVEAGETGGSLPSLLAKLASYIQQAEYLRQKVTGALYYPVTVSVIAFLITIFIFLFGVRQFQEIYQGLNVPLPWGTRVLMGIGNLMWTLGPFILLGLAVLGYLLSRYLQTEAGETFRDGLILKMPGLGPLMRRVAIARFARTLATLYSGGVSLLNSLELVAQSMGNRVMESIVAKAAENVKEGESLSTPLRDSGLFTRMSVSMITTGEETGTLDTMLNEVADFYEQQVDVALKAMVSMIEPIVIVGVGIAVGGLLIALGLPMLNLVQALG